MNHLRHAPIEFINWLKTRKKRIATTLIWSMTVALVIIKSYWLVYVTRPIIVEKGMIWAYVPHLDIWDYLLIFFLSVIAGALLLDLETVFYGYIAATILSFSFAIAYSSFFIWYVLRWGEMTSFLDIGLVLGWVIYGAIYSMFRLFFPFAIIVCLLGVFLGAFGRGYLQPSADPL